MSRRVTSIEVDESQWPHVLVRFPDRPVDDTELRDYLDHLSRIASIGQPYTTLTDLSDMPEPLSARQRWMFDEWLQTNFSVLQRAAAGNAILACTAVARAAAATAYWNWYDPPVYRLFDSLGDAARWCRERLARRLASDGAAPAPSPVTATSDTRPPVRAPLPDQLPTAASIIDLFSEPAFLVSVEGAVVFANRAARRTFPPPRPWLAHVLSNHERDTTMPVRVARITVDGRPLHLVIADEGARFADLPPSLRRVAELLSRGLSDKEIAAETGLSFATVRTYVRRLYARAGVHSRAELLRAWFAGRG